MLHPYKQKKTTLKPNLAISRNYRFYRNGNFCKKTKFAKLLRELKSMPVSYNEKVSVVFLACL